MIGHTGHVGVWNDVALYIFTVFCPCHWTPVLFIVRLFTCPIEGYLAIIATGFVARDYPCEHADVVVVQGVQISEPRITSCAPASRDDITCSSEGSKVMALNCRIWSSACNAKASMIARQ